MGRNYRGRGAEGLSYRSVAKPALVALCRVGSCCPTPCPSLTLPHATLGGEPGVAQVDGCSPGGVPFLTPLTGEGSLKAPSPCPLFPWLPYTE